MKTLYKIVIGLAMTAILSTMEAQNTNGGSGQNVDTICFGGLKVTQKVEAELAAIPLLNISPASKEMDLPDGVDNSKQDWFRSIFRQKDGCCGQAAGVGYTFTYEVNRMRGSQANVPTNLYPTHFTYNFLNEEDTARGSWPHHGWKVIKQMGVPTVEDYGGMYKNITSPDRINVWETGYNHYYNALSNKVVLSYEKETLTNYEKIEKIKHWLNDHGKGEASGGLAVFCANVFNYTSDTLPPESDSAGQWVVTGWGNDGLHAMTIVGYDDNIMYDFDHDGQFTNTGGISNWERGAFIVANSWGPNHIWHDSQWLYSNQGYLYVPYQLAASFFRYEVYCLTVTNTYTPEVVLKARVKHPSRLHLEFFADYAPNASSPGIGADSAYVGLNWEKDTSFCDLAMQGLQNNNDPIELGLDFGQFFKELLNTGGIGKVFFVVKEIGDTPGNGTYDGEVTNYSLIDYRWNEIFELPYSIDTVPIENNGETRLGINYDLLPFDGGQLPNTWNTDKVVRRRVNVGSNIQIGDSVNMDLYGTDSYECEMFFKSNTTLTIGDGVTFTAKRGTCRIVVNGNLVLGENVRFCAENGATLELDFSNAQSVSSFNGTIFQNCDLSLPEKSLSFQGCTFTETPLVMENRNSVSGLSATVGSCSFVATTRQFANAIYINHYDFYGITNNTINGNESHYTNGISVMNCGNTNIESTKIISNNSISDCIENGLVFYASTGKILKNKITGNKIGVKLLDNCNVKDFSGICYATDPQNTQYIHDNGNIEVNISRNCIPSRMEFNAITASSSHPYIQYEDNTNTMLNIDITYNYWGSGLVPNTHFVSTNPNASFVYSPLWSLGGCPANGGNDIDMIGDADSLSGIGKYGEAKSVYKQIVNLYPSTVNAQVALKTLFNLECVSDQDFEGLKSYYLNDTVIAGNDNLSKLASSLSNRCNEALHHYNDAIAWYENVLLDSLSSFNDSIFAAIDLGDLYLRMEAMEEKGLAGKLTQFIPVSREAYEKQVSYALSLLPHSEQKTMDDYPTDYWTDVVTEQPEGYVVDENGDVHLYSAEALAWLISTVNGLNGQETDNFDGKKVTLESNVDMSAARWISIAYGTNIGDPDPDRLKFCGSFDGNGFVINGLVLSSNPFYHGNFMSFFGNLCGARIENVVLQHVYSEGRNEIGGLFFGNTEPLETGEETRQNVIDRCFFEVDEMNKSVQDRESALFGYRNDGVITNCMVKCGKASYPENNCQDLGLFVYYNHGNIENCASVVDSLKWLREYSGIAVINYGLIENCYSFIDNWFGWDCLWPPLPRLGVSAVNYGTIRNCYYNTFKYEDASWSGSYFDDEPVSHNYGSIENTVPFEPTPYFQTPYWIFADTVSITSHTGFVYQTLQLEEALNDWVLGQENDADYLYWCADPFCLISVFPNHLPSFYDFDIAGASENTANNDQVLLYPNPTTGMVTVTGENLQQAEVFNMLGQKLLSVKGKGNELQINMSAIPSGIYFVTVIDEEGRICVCKVVKE